MSDKLERATGKLDHLLRWLSVPQHSRGLILMRSSFGWILAYIYAVNYAQRDLLFGPDRITASPAGLFGLLPGAAGFDVMYILAIVAAVCFALGIGGRVTTIINFAYFCSYSSLAVLTSDGGDNLLRLVLFYMIFSDLSKNASTEKTTLHARISGMLHNVSWLAIVTQLCILYWDAGFQKAAGQMWRDGTALYYILQLSEFHDPIVADALLRHPTLLVFSTYATMVFQLAFPFLLLNRWSKYAAIAISMSFHLGIMFAMSLISFSAIMMSTELALLSDADYASLSRTLRSLSTSIIRLAPARMPSRKRNGALDSQP